MKKLKGWLIYTEEDYKSNQDFAHRFVDQAWEHQMEIRLVLTKDLFYGIRNNALLITSGSLSLPDFVINRTTDTLLAMQLEAMGIRVFNNSEISAICNDKARTYQEAVRLGLPVVDTLFLTKKMLAACQYTFTFPAVLKSVGGRGGREVFLVENAKEVAFMAANISSDRFVLQKLCGNPGRDVRVFVMGKRIIGAIERSSKKDFKANYKLGGSAGIYNLSAQEKSLVSKLTHRFDFGFAGIDFIFDENQQFLFNEIEDVVGSRTLHIYAGINAVGLYLEHISDIFRGTSQK